MNYSSLGKFYDDIFQMKYEHGFSISEMENLMPFERDLMVHLVNKHLSDQAELERLRQLQIRNVESAIRRKR